MIDIKTIKFWAKTTDNGLPGISVQQHMFRVGYIARYLAMLNKKMLEVFNLELPDVSILAALHDVGKVSQGFERKCPAWLEEYNLVEKDSAEAWYALEKDHSKISQFSVQNFLKSVGLKTSSASLWALAVGVHHGRLHWAGSRGLKSGPGMKDDEWEELRNNEIEKVVGEFGQVRIGDVNLDDSHKIWWLAGLISVADWIGSDEHFFSASQPTKNLKHVAADALTKIGFSALTVRKNLDFRDLFGFESPNELQLLSAECITKPGIYAIEAPMGMGKTEAALLISYHLLSNEKANGIYFALPTQATSNRIHFRMADFINRIFTEKNKTRLIHGNSWLIEDLNIPKINPINNQDNGNAIVRDWFASRKRALLSAFGVGTIDQALLAVIAAKHFFVRRFALAGKVVIIDEVHSYDMYTGTLVKRLCHELKKLNCTVILLSATLTQEYRDKLLGISREITEVEPNVLISGIQSDDLKSIYQPVIPPSEKEIDVSFIELDKAKYEALTIAQQGGAVLWICNTVASSQKTFSNLVGLAKNDGIEIGLLHSRFPFHRREMLENKWMKILGKGDEHRKGCILVSTQIVEQSVDLDADLMITELAPTDMLLQRLGRLWRHKRSFRPNKKPSFRILKEQKELDELRSMPSIDIEQVLGSKAKVYAPYVLLRSLELWGKKRTLRLPVDIKPMIIDTYKERFDSDPDEWRTLADDWVGNNYAKEQIANMETNEFLKALDDIEGIRTRLNEVENVSIVLVCDISHSEVTFLDGSKIKLDENSFDIESARAVNKNLVRVPKYSIVNELSTVVRNKYLEKYIHGDCCWATVGEDGLLSLSCGQSKELLIYDDDIGVQNIKRG